MARLVRRGEIWVVDLNPGFRHEIHKKRPALVISDNNFNQTTSYVIVIPASSIISSTIGKEMVLVEGEDGLDKKSVLLPLLVRSIDRERLIKKVGNLSQTKLFEVEESLKLVLGLVEFDN